MKIALLTFLLVPLFFAGSLHAGEKRNKDFDQIMPPTLKHPPETEARLNKWFRDSKFGAFIHFGAYSPLAGKYKDRVTPKNYAEWVQMDLEIPYEEYRKEVVSQFNPTATRPTANTIITPCRNSSTVWFTRPVPAAATCSTADPWAMARSTPRRWSYSPAWVTGSATITNRSTIPRRIPCLPVLSGAMHPSPRMAKPSTSTS